MVGVAALFLSSITLVESDALPETLSLKLYNLHTHERATIVFKRNGVYDQAGLKQLNVFLRDWRANLPTKMDPHLFDLIYQVYQRSGSSDYINVVCGFRSPPTNAMLRRRSRGVAQNSLHMQGKAMDFFIPDVPLAKLREIGLQMQLGGVGFYPTSGSPFVHMDTGNVRHWPRMTRQQLVKVFPNGRTLHIPSDGKPLPGYAEALASYKQRMAARTPIGAFVDNTAVASNDAADDAEDDVTAAEATSAPTAVGKPIAVAMAAYATAPTPLPHIAPRRVPDATTPPPVVTLASIATYGAVAAPTPPPVTIAGMTGGGTVKPRITQAAILAAATQRTNTLAPDFDFGPASDWTPPAVPAALAQAMAERDTTRRYASLPISPTAVVATIDVSRPLRAEAITTAVLRTNTQADDAPLPTVLGYAAPDPLPQVVKPRRAVMTDAGVPLPLISPLHDDTVAAATAAEPPAPIRAVRPKVQPVTLTMTALDTQALRMWIGPVSTRQKPYALLTMPDYVQEPDLMAKPDLAFRAGFSAVAYTNLRTDTFAGPLVQQPDMVDLTPGRQVASIR